MSAICGREPALDISAQDELRRRPVTLARLELIEAAVPQVEAFRSAVGVRRERRALYVRWWDQDGRWGIGECSCRPDPFYSAEFNEAVKDLFVHVYARLLPTRGSLGDIASALGRVRGWHFARAAVLDALLDLVRRRGGEDGLDRTPSQTAEIPVGISLGVFATPAAAIERVERALGEGFRRIKMKVVGGESGEVFTAVRQRFPDAPLAFDANGSCTEADLESLLPMLADLAPTCLEQPFAPRRLDLAARLKELRPSVTLCLDESVGELGDLLAAHALGAIDELNLKPGRVGGQLAALEILTRCEELAIPTWVGGMFETGVGRWANLRLAACMPGAGGTAHDLSPSSRYFRADVVEEPVTMSAEGTVAIGGGRPVSLDERALDRMTVWRDEVVPQGSEG